MRRVEGLVQLARCPCASAIPTAGPALDSHLPRSWVHALHATGPLGVANFQLICHNSSLASAVGDATSLPVQSCCSTSDSLAASNLTSSLADCGSSTLMTSPLELTTPVAAEVDISLSISAASSLEDSLALVLSPTQLGVQLWEGAHAASGLPWWAAIPAATVAVRSALLPLSLRAYAASTNIVLLQRAFGLTRAVAEAVAAAEKQTQEQQRRRREELLRADEGTGGDGRLRDRNDDGSNQKPVSSSSSSSSSNISSSISSSSSIGGGGGNSTEVELSQLDLLQRVFSHMRVQSAAPSFGWYMGNAMVQVPLAVSLSLALRRMSGSLWPGFTGEGLLYFQDLTAPPMYLETLSTPYGTAGAMLPLALVLLYMSAADRSSGGSSPGIHMALKLLVLPLYCAALLQPHAVLLYWLSHAATQLGVYGLAARLPALRRAVGVPELTIWGVANGGAGSGAGSGEEVQTKDAAQVDEVLLALSESYTTSGKSAAARKCLESLLIRQPGHKAAMQRLRALMPATKTQSPTSNSEDS